jgi:hypothetical protein
MSTLKFLDMISVFHITIMFVFVNLYFHKKEDSTQPPLLFYI